MSEGQARRGGGRRKRGVDGAAPAVPEQAPPAPEAAGREEGTGPEPAAQGATATGSGAGPGDTPPAGGRQQAGARSDAGAGAGVPHVDRSVCLCAGLGPMLTQALRTLSVPDEVKHSLHDTEREALRLLRTLVEMRLSTLGGDDSRPREPARGVKLDVS